MESFWYQWWGGFIAVSGIPWRNEFAKFGLRGNDWMGLP